MADEEKNEAPKKDEKKESKSKGKSHGGGGGMLVWILLGVVTVMVCAGAGIGIGFMSGPSSDAEVVPPVEDDLPSAMPNEIREDFAYYEFESLVVNLNVPRQNRYVKITPLLGVLEKDRSKTFDIFEKKKDLLKDRLRRYLAGHTLDQVSGQKNLVRIQREITDSFNELLWPDHRPMIDHVLFKDFAIQ